jgi:NodT family efflux transporter outer membrane factor (OMF) lipoprotein
MNRLALIVMAAALSACTTLGPDYEEPPVEWLESWQTNLYGQVGGPEQQSELDLQFWWQVFDDPELNRLIEVVKTENPSLRIAGLRVLESRALLGIAGSTRYPQAQQATGAVSYVNSSESDGNVTSYQAGFNLGWEIDFWGRFQRGIESADAAFFASIYNHQDLQVLLNAQVADLYFAYRTVLLRIGIAENNAAIQKRSLEITTRLFESGEDSELDLQQAKTQYLATLSSIPGLQISETKVRNAIAALLGRAPGDLPELTTVSKPLPMMNPVVINEIPASLLMRRPDIRAAAWQAAAQSAQIGIAEADLYPAISLLGTIGWSGNSVSGSSSTSALGVGPAVTWNLFDHGLIRNNVRVQDARLQQAIESYQNNVLQAAREIDDAAISIVKSRENQEILAESVTAAERSLQLATARYREGYADFQRVLDAQRSVATQTERELVNQGSHISAIIEFYKALGGGWQVTPIEQLIPAATRETMESRSKWGDLLSAPLPVTPEN